ncbi:MAG TPA: penicillin acylase family protein [Catenuloplanes sp.]
MRSAYQPHPPPRYGLRRWRIPGLLTSLAVLVPAGITPVAAAEVDSGRPPAGEAVIRRTAHGIPHILAADYRGLGLGAGYAFAEDNLCSFARTVVTLAGQRSRSFGPGDHMFDPPGNRASDIYHTWVNRSRVVERLLAGAAPIGPSPRARELVRGYAAGYNRYLAQRTVAGLPDPDCRGAGWVRPITELDVWRRAYRLAGNNGGERELIAIVAATPPRPDAGGTAKPRAGNREFTRRPATASGPPLRPRTTPGPASNAVAIGRSASAGRTGLLLANPHLPWQGGLLLSQQHLTIPGELDVSGAGFHGLPVVAMGHTDRLAWTHTASTAETTTLTRLTLADGDPTSYVVDGQRRRMERTTVTVTVRQDDGGPRPEQHTIYRTPDGPVLADDWRPWSTRTAYVLHDANADNLRIIDQSLAMGRSHSVAQLHAALGRHVGIPWANTVAADAGGSAYYSDIQVVPHVTDELIRRCGRRDDFGGVVLDGSRSACGWGSDADAVTPGLFGPGRLPSLTRTDVVSNMNDSPWLTNPAAPLTGYPSIVGDIGTARGARTRLGLDMIADRLDGGDGLGPPGFTLATLQRTMLGNRNLSAEHGRPAVVAMCRANPRLPASGGTPVDVTAACGVLADWNGRADLDSRGAFLWQRFIRAAGANEVRLDAVPFDPADPVHTPRGVAADNLAVRTVFADTVRQFNAAGVPVDVALRDVQRFAGVPIHGCDNGCFNAIWDHGAPGGAGALPDVSYGSTFIMAVELTATGPRSRTLLVYGQSSDVTSPRHTDQARRYAAKQWVTGRFTAAEIARDPELTVRTLPG